jgi:predicted ATPase
MPARRKSNVPESREPFLRGVRTLPDAVDPSQFPFTIPFLKGGLDLDITRKVTLFVGENGSGKSTLLEGIAVACGFGSLGGTRDHRASNSSDDVALAAALRLSWKPKVTEGFFMRAESFFDFSKYIDAVGRRDLYGGDAPLLEQSHGESFLSLFRNRWREGLFILDEPEAALSPQRQLAFLRILRDLEDTRRAQFLIATHSPILLLYPGAEVFSLDSGNLETVDPNQTEHVRLTKDFLSNPARYFRAIFDDQNDSEDAG